MNFMRNNFVCVRSLFAYIIMALLIPLNIYLNINEQNIQDQSFLTDHGHIFCSI